jgi:hypothetical protein
MSDRTKPPPDYELHEDTRAHEPEVGLFGSLWWPSATFERSPLPSEQEAVEQCLRHHNRIGGRVLRGLLPAIRAKLGEVAGYQENGYGVGGVLDAERYLVEMIEARADELDPGDPKGTP